MAIRESGERFGWPYRIMFWLTLVILMASLIYDQIVPAITPAKVILHGLIPLLCLGTAAGSLIRLGASSGQAVVQNPVLKAAPFVWLAIACLWTYWLFIELMGWLR
ncbi:MAG: hypothetical protein V1738_02880 [Patescibacteria group bacterium]